MRGILIALTLLAACRDAPNGRERLSYGHCSAAYAIVAASPAGDRKTITEAFDSQSSYDDWRLWVEVERLARAGRIRITETGMYAVPPEDWPDVDSDGNAKDPDA